jgi:hypothetical protein
MIARASARLAAEITRGASLQTYCTIRLLVHRERVADACRAYAYFRWVDDCLDEKLGSRPDRAAFVARQEALIASCYAGQDVPTASSEEQMLVHLIRAHPDPKRGLAGYVRNMMAVMSFDAERRGRLITRRELNAYTQALAVAVTEALHYFIGRAEVARRAPGRYASVTGAHIAHMLRDTFEDNQAGYYNIPAEALERNRITPFDIESPGYRDWVQGRVAWARHCFRIGRKYMAEVEGPRCLLATDAYAARFAGVLGLIEHDSYRLRPEYPARRSLHGGFALTTAAISSVLRGLIPAGEPPILSPR